MRKIIRMERGEKVFDEREELVYTRPDRYYSDTYYTFDKGNSLYKVVRRAIKNKSRLGIMTYEEGLLYEVYSDCELFIIDRKTAVRVQNMLIKYNKLDSYDSYNFCTDLLIEDRKLNTIFTHNREDKKLESFFTKRKISNKLLLTSIGESSWFIGEGDEIFIHEIKKSEEFLGDTVLFSSPDVKLGRYEEIIFEMNKQDFDYVKKISVD